MDAIDSIRAPVPAAPTALPGDPGHVLAEHVRDHPRIDVAIFLVVDRDRRSVEPGASWFASPVLEQAVLPRLTRPYDAARPGLVETVLDRGQTLFLVRVDSWEAAGRLRTQLQTGADRHRADELWEALGQASLIACPVTVPLGRTTGMLAVASLDPGRPLRRDDLATVTALADLLALTHERVAESRAAGVRERRELLLKRATEDAAASLEIPEVEAHVAESARELVEADRVTLVRPGPELDAGAAAEVARTRTPHIEELAIHVPVALGPRIFGVLSAFRDSGRPFDGGDADLLGRLARGCAAAIANAVDFERERRIARALTRGFVPDSLPRLPDWDLGLLYEPAASQSAGGDVYGVWHVPGGEVAVLIGDVAGKGVETAALSAMARFFIEARSWACDSPAEILRQANTLLSERLPSDTFVTTFLGLLTPAGLRYANAGHLPPLLLAGDQAGEVAGGGLPLGVSTEVSYRDHTLPLRRGDALLAYTDGVAEARGQGELFGAERVRDAALEAAGGDMQSLVASVHAAAKSFSGGLQDDAVLLALRHR